VNIYIAHYHFEESLVRWMRYLKQKGFKKTLKGVQND